MKFFLLYALMFITPLIQGQETQRIYLSGAGSNQTVNWQFYCTQGRNSGHWTTIHVPSNWELQGFGNYNYGLDKDSLIGKEKGLYKYQFKVPAEWKDKIISIVFEGSMTDTEVKINGIQAGEKHQGAFYRFTYNVTSLLKFDKRNFLEVTVAKHSENLSVNNAERKADYWIFGGIYRPVYLEAKPTHHISKIALNAKADGSFQASVLISKSPEQGELMAQIYTPDGKPFGNPFSTKINKGDTLANISNKINSPLLWNPESPNLYETRLTLSYNGEVNHQVKQRFGFRTIELRERDGIYVNGVKIKFKGVNRHCFWPSTGRTTNKKQSIADVELIKDMNMNAVRMAHYPPDEHFLDVCDSLGLFVLDELAGWHHYYDTPTGTKLIREMTEKDGNHPSVIMWCSGDEGGHNPDFPTVFDRSDIQKRPVIEPWRLCREIDTQHYRDYDYGNGTYFHGHDVFFPTEFLHGLYDGGSGAGLEDYWELMWNNPLSAGGFLWSFADEDVIRTDKNGIIDNDGSHAPDGILSPFHQKEASYYTIKEVWAPVYFEKREITPSFNGTFRIQNRFLYTNIEQCSFSWKLKKLSYAQKDNPNASNTGVCAAPNIQPGQFGTLSVDLPSDWKEYDALYITAQHPDKHEIYTWSWPISLPSKIAQTIISKETTKTITAQEPDSSYTFEANDIKISFNRKMGLLQKVSNTKGVIPFNNGPILCEGETDFQGSTYRKEGNNIIVENTYGAKSHFKQVTWTIYPTGWLKLDVKYMPTSEETTFMGISFSYPEKLVKGIKWMGNGPYRVWKNRLKGNALDIWSKAYNNTVTGESQNPVYPEFKGYYSNLYWFTLETTEQPITVVCENEDIFLRLFTPQSPKETFNVTPAFPKGDISFMHGITAIGTKGQKPENLGPMGKKNMYFDYWKDRPKEMTLYFDFSGN
jgi:hypothetical protein